VGAGTGTGAGASATITTWPHGHWQLDSGRRTWARNPPQSTLSKQAEGGTGA